MLTKADPRESNTGYAQGGIAAAVGPAIPRHCTRRHDCRRRRPVRSHAAVELLVEEGPRYVRELIEWGARSIAIADGKPQLALRGGAQRPPRPARRRCDRTRDRRASVDERVSRLPTVATVDHARVVGLIVEERPLRAAPRSCTDDGVHDVADAAAVLLATGGAGQVFSETTNPPVATGDGDRDGLSRRRARHRSRVRAVPSDGAAMPGQPRFLLSEALRGEGARLVNAAGEAFMDALRSSRRSRAARPRRPGDRARSAANGRAGLPVDAASRPRLRPCAVSDDCRMPAGVRVSISRAIRFRSGPPRIT